MCLYVLRQFHRLQLCCPALWKIYIYIYAGDLPQWCHVFFASRSSFTHKYIYIHIHIYLHIYICIYIHIYICIYIHIYICIYIHIYIYIYTRTCTLHVHVHVRLRVRVRVGGRGRERGGEWWSVGGWVGGNVLVRMCVLCVLCGVFVLVFVSLCW